MKRDPESLFFLLSRVRLVRPLRQLRGSLLLNFVDQRKNLIEGLITQCIENYVTFLYGQV